MGGTHTDLDRKAFGKSLKLEESSRQKDKINSLGREHWFAGWGEGGDRYASWHLESRGQIM